MRVTATCDKCDEEFTLGWSRGWLQTDEEWEPECFCSMDCYEQYYQFALGEED